MAKVEDLVETRAQGVSVYFFFSDSTIGTSPTFYELDESEYCNLKRATKTRNVSKCIFVAVARVVA